MRSIMPGELLPLECGTGFRHTRSVNLPDGSTRKAFSGRNHPILHRYPIPMAATTFLEPILTPAKTINGAVPTRDEVPANEILCEYCTAKCCRYFALPIDEPPASRTLITCDGTCCTIAPRYSWKTTCGTCWSTPPASICSPTIDAASTTPVLKSVAITPPTTASSTRMRSTRCTSRPQNKSRNTPRLATTAKAIRSVAPNRNFAHSRLIQPQPAQPTSADARLGVLSRLSGMHARNVPHRTSHSQRVSRFPAFGHDAARAAHGDRPSSLSPLRFCPHRHTYPGILGGPDWQRVPKKPTAKCITSPTMVGGKSACVSI
jgi:hypothetical protein